MAAKEFKAIGTSTTSTIENRKRKEVLVQNPKQFSQQFDLSDLIGMDPEQQRAIASLPYEIRSKDGRVLLAGKTDVLGDTGRVFTQGPEEVSLFVGDGEWTLGLDCMHE